LKKPLLVTVCLLALASAGGAATTAPVPSPVTEVVVTLSSPSLTSAFHSRLLSYGAVSRGKRLDLRSLASRRYLNRLASSQAAFSRRIETAVPSASVRWHYRVVANGLAVSLPSNEVSLLSELPGVAHVYPSYRYRALETGVPGNVSAIGASELWKSDLSNAGQGIKIGIIDDGIDQTHSYFDPTTYTYPVGYPQGNTAYTTAKVIVARAFAPSGLGYANASLPFDPKYSSHGTFVAGIAAGNAGTTAIIDGKAQMLSGVAPRAYLGNYKALTIPTEQFGLNGNSPEIVAAIDAAVSDGMNVINLSIGEPEIAPRNDVVAKAVNAASAAGVVVVAAAGNEYGENGEGSIDSPGSAASAITVGASSSASTASGGVRIASFSSAGPTPYGLLLKPSVSAPGVDVLSSASADDGSWISESGTSAASPHVAGAVALLRQLHPTWTVSQIKSSLVLTGTPITTLSGRELSPLRGGGGRIAVLSASQPLVFASPSSVGFGFVKRGQSVTQTVTLSDADAAVGSCQVRIRRSESTSGASLQVPASVTVPGTLSLKASVKATASEGDFDGWITLTCAGQERRIPFWLHVAVSRLGEKKRARLARSGVYRGDTKGETALVDHYLYPERAPGVRRLLKGPEQVFRFSLPSSRQNVGVVVLSHARGVSVSPRIVRGDNESKLAGLTALPINVNPYVDSFDTTEPVAGVLRPAAGVYYVVFDTTSAAKAGRFSFRFWVNDVTPPRLRTLSRRAGLVTVEITDRGSGVDPKSISATVGKRQLELSFDSCTGKAIINAKSLGVGKHTLVLSASDYQESKNNENSSRLLPNTAERNISVSIPKQISAS
jgi:subtilisin family serine protease